eukprot:GHVL01006519.1.p1 GENE.GHVL01006519.1~~GHVL01006519.1.p1  ORF type:complete len:250 (+),score=55.80 GHVL01006519.1:909-1658(+)
MGLVISQFHKFEWTDPTVSDIFNSFTSKFRVTASPRSVWILYKPNSHDDARRAHIKRLRKCCRQLRGPRNVASLLFICLCRSLNIPSRLTLHIPVSSFRVSETLWDVDALTESINRQKNEKNDENLTRKTPLKEAKTSSRLWCEIYQSVINKWISIDIGIGEYNYDTHIHGSKISYLTVSSENIKKITPSDEGVSTPGGVKNIKKITPSDEGVSTPGGGVLTFLRRGGEIKVSILMNPLGITLLNPMIK